MFGRIRRWLEDRRIRRLGLTRADWDAAVAGWRVLDRYAEAQRQALFAMVMRFLVRKDFVSGGGFPLDDAICLRIATMACVPVLELGLDWYDSWYTVIVYESDFVPNGPWVSEDGIVHERAPGLSGEAWHRGPVIVSWEAVRKSGEHHGHGYNVVIHEVTHKLDMLHDGANGAPPMHPDMSAVAWHEVFSAAWQRLQHDWDADQPLPIDDYALSSPAEFFAVCSEGFFEAPASLKRHLPDIYRLLVQFYRQDPLSRATDR